MFIFVGGITPKTRKIDDNPRRCPDCGLHQAYQMRVDHYLSLFFIPVLRVKKGEPFVRCERCRMATHQPSRDPPPDRQENRRTCKFCRNPVHEGFIYCPFCGKKL